MAHIASPSGPHPTALVNSALRSRGRAPGRISKETWIAILSLAGIAIYVSLRHFAGAPESLALIPIYLVLLIGGSPLVLTLFRKLVAGDFGSDLLAGVSIVTAVLLGHYLVGAIVVLMLSGGAALESYATQRASSVLDALAKRMPGIAHRKRKSALEDIGLEAIRPGDEILVLPHEICPVDGTVLEGNGTMDEAYLTGEPFQISKAPGSHVLSGTVNGDSALTIVASRLAIDSRYSRIMKVVEATNQNRPHLRRIGDRLGAWYTPVAVLIATGSWIFSHDPIRFLAVVVVATPCPLLIAIPVAVIGAISLSARKSIIIKNPAALEQVDTCRTIIFDKTGTLTYGRPRVTEVVAAPGFGRDEALRLAASLERYSKHPLASAVVDAAEQSNLTLEAATDINERPGEGLRGIVAGRRVEITGRKKLGTISLPPPSTGLECIVLVEGAFTALIRFHDSPRSDSKFFMRHLKPHHHVQKVMLVSGDRESEVRYLAKMVGIREIYAGKSPEEKVEIVRREVALGKTLFVGDGINDAPALIVATVGVAFGHNSDIAVEAADVVIMEASLRRIDELIHIGRRMRSIAFQSAVGGMALSLAGMIIAALGYLPPIGGAIAQEVIDLAAVLNALRVAFPPGDLADF